jgi:cytochrome P450
MRSVIRLTTLVGTCLDPGELMCAWVASANRDEEIFLEPGMVRSDRTPALTSRSPLASTFCLGVSLGRLEIRLVLIRLVFESLLARVDRIDLLGAPIGKPTNLVTA